VLADDRAGNVAQALGVADALDLPFTLKEVRYTRLAALPNALRGAGLTGVSGDTRRALAPPWPDLVIAAGRRTAPVARWIKGRAGGRSFLCQIMHPGTGLADFDLVAVPRHDHVEPGGNVLAITGAPHRVTPERLAEAADEWRERFEALPEPRIALIVGGSTRRTRFTPDMAAELGRLASATARAHDGSLLVTTSRRTGPSATDALDRSIDRPAAIWRWGAGEGANPYFGLLALSRAVIVTGDSVSMCSEACGTEKLVFIYAPEGAAPARHRRLHRELFDRGLAAPLTEAAACAPLARGASPGLNAAEDVAAAIRARLGLR
jgi:hypothetical protein